MKGVVFFCRKVFFYIEDLLLNIIYRITFKGLPFFENLWKLFFFRKYSFCMNCLSYKRIWLKGFFYWKVFFPMVYFLLNRRRTKNNQNIFFYGRHSQRYPSIAIFSRPFLMKTFGKIFFCRNLLDRTSSLEG